eukprot:CAMPEP_0168534078 /NCGR_PEP_ID=MMETSP0405-20121227/17602_1 /TAXON_ID=498012 /ORGANISM="Trichosphaerium sp, Strain Am-I-7 wt" /LENGTH=254 /DNA_ID=CAMNT_0008560549 /DNA_START=666 /DNA_END=1430 /DNA_ORIENTATION=-
MTEHLDRDPVLKNDKKHIAQLDILKTNFKLHHQDLLNSTREEIVDNNQGVLQQFVSSNNKLSEPEITQRIWGSLMSVWFGVSKLPWFTHNWGEDKADILKLSTIEYTALISQLSDDQDFLVKELARFNPLNVQFFSILISSLIAIVNLAGSFKEVALECAQSTWYNYTQCSNMSCFPGSYFIAYNCCFVAIRNADVSLFIESFRTLIALANPWVHSTILVKALYDEAKDYGFDLTPFKATMDEIERTQPVNIEE